MKIKTYDPFNVNAKDIEPVKLEFEKVSSEINDTIQKIVEKGMYEGNAKVLRNGEVSIVGVSVIAKNKEPEQVFLPQELNEMITEVVIAYYEKRSRE